MKVIRMINSFQDNNIGYYLKKYVSRKNFCNFGWGNIGTEMIMYDFPNIKINKTDINCYKDSQGEPCLINEVIKFINNKSKIKISKRNIIITNGATNSIFLLSQFFKNNLKINEILMQNPTYDTAINIFKSQNYFIKTINPEFCNLKNYNVKLSYLMFRFHNPTGLSIDDGQEKEIKTQLLKFGYLIEDDSYGLFDNRNKINIIKNKKYIYIGSFSKYIFPGMHLGYIIADKKIIDTLILMQKYYNSYPNILSQINLLHYLKTGKIEKEIYHKVKILVERRKLFESLLSSRVKKLLNYSNSGFYYWLKLPQNVNSRKIFIALLKKGVFVIPGDIYFIDKPYGALRICIGNIDNISISKGVKILNNVLGYELRV